MMALSVATATSGAEKKLVTNADIVSMIRAGLPESTIILAIRQGPSGFDISPTALIELKNQGASPGMLEAMLQPIVPPAPVENATTMPSGVKVWVDHEGTNISLRSVMGYKEASIGQAFKQRFGFSFKNKFAILIRGTRASTRLSSSPPRIYTRHDLSQSGLVKLTVQEDRDRRYVWVASRIGSTAGEFYPPECDTKGEIKDIGNGIQTLTFTNTLAPGEYGFVATENEGRSYVVYDFAIDAK
jgi:hypothetical protein